MGLVPEKVTCSVSELSRVTKIRDETTRVTPEIDSFLHRQHRSSMLAFFLVFSLLGFCFFRHGFRRRMEASNAYILDSAAIDSAAIDSAIIDSISIDTINVTQKTP